MNDTAMPLEIDCLGTKALLDASSPGFVFLDCREPDEYQVARIDGARLMPMSEIASRLTELAPHRADRIVVHCHHGGRSLRVARWLREQGYSKAQSMAGGIDVWSQTIDPSVPRY